MRPVILPRVEAADLVAREQTRLGALGLAEAPAEVLELLAAGFPIVEGMTRTRLCDGGENPPGGRGLHVEVMPSPHAPAWAVEVVRRLLYAPLPQRPEDEAVESILRDAATDAHLRRSLCEALDNPDRLALLRLTLTLTGD